MRSQVQVLSPRLMEVEQKRILLAVADGKILRHLDFGNVYLLEGERIDGKDVIALAREGLIERPSGLSGKAARITDKGREVLASAGN